MLNYTKYNFIGADHHACQTSGRKREFSSNCSKIDQFEDESCQNNKRARTIFTAEQLEQMEREFQKQQYVVGHERMYLANALNLTEAQVRIIRLFY